MTLQDVEEAAVRGAMSLKEHVCRKGPRDIKAVVDVYRGDDLVAIVVPAQHQRDLILQVFTACAIGFDGDALAMTIESYSAIARLDLLDPNAPVDVTQALQEMRNPLTGQQWASGEMSDAVQHHGALEKGWVVEALSISCANRAGDLTLAQLPYRYSGKHLVWLERPPMVPAGAQGTGIIPEAMVKAMNSPSLASLLPYLPTEGTRAERDVMAAELMMQTFPCAVALMANARQTDRVRVLRTAGIQF